MTSRDISVVELGSSLTRVVLDPDQIKGDTDSSETGFPVLVPVMSGAGTLISIGGVDISCQPTLFPDGALPGGESKVLIRTEAVKDEELRIVILSFVSLKESAKL